MKKTGSNRVFAAALAALLAGPVASGAEAQAVSALPESVIRLEGDSTLRKFTSTASKFRFEAKVTGDAKIDEKAAPWIFREFELVIPVKAMKSGDETLDEHMQEAMKTEEHPDIRIKLSSFKLGEKNSDGTRAVDAAGEISVSGVTKPIELQATVSVEGRKVKASGQKKLLMTDYGIEPPTMMLGTIRTRNEINIVFEAAFAPRETNPTEGKAN